MTSGPALGRYILERRIASGGMADVYLARQTGAYGFVKHVAVKVLKQDITNDDEHIKMFIREALVSAEFRHTNLAQVYEVGETDGRLFIAMELVRGVSVATLLKELSDRKRELPMNVAVRIAIDTLDGLAHAHEAAGADGKPLGLVHRDVSPQNIMVAVDGTVKVVDFGIARAELAFGKTMAPRVKGKFSYMPPEQWEASGRIDARTDIFALGVVLYEMTTGGERLFRGETPKDVYKAVVMDKIPPPDTRVPGYPPGLARIVMRALERGPSARWPSARAMRGALVDWAQEQGWSLTSRAVADALRSAIGSNEIESRWETVAGAEPGALDENASTVVDVPTNLERPARISARPSALPEPQRGQPQVAQVLVAGLGVLAVAVGSTGGYWVGRRDGRAQAARALEAPRVGSPVAVSSPRRVRVRGTPVLLGEGPARVLRERWGQSHPEVELVFSAGSPSEALAALSLGTADVALTPRRAGATEPGGADTAATHVLVGRGVVVLAVAAQSPVQGLTLAQARAVYHGGEGPLPGVALRVVARPPATDLLALADATLLDGAASTPGAVLAETDAAARAQLASDPRAVTLFERAALDPADRAVRVVPITPDAGSDPAPPLSYPLWAVGPRALTGDARAFVDWLRASDILAALRPFSVVPAAE